MKHLSGTLRVANICYFLLACLLSHVIDICRHIIIPHLRERELPEFLIRVRVQSLMLTRVFCTSMIATPNIIASFRKDECWRLVTVGNPILSRAQ